MNIHCSPILHVCMNDIKGVANFKNFQILLDSGFISTIVMIRFVEKLCPEKYSVMHWQAGIITTSFNVKIEFTLPALIATNVVTRKFHVDDSAKYRYDMILVRYVLT